MEYDIFVTSTNDLFYYWYAVVLDDPGHSQGDEPKFEFEVLDSSGQTIDTTLSNVISYTLSTSGFYTSSANSNYRCKTWTLVGVDISQHLGII